MGQPGGGRTFISPRILRHFSLISLANFDDDTINRIFGTILDWYFKKGNFNPEIIKFNNKLINGTIEIYHIAMSELLPTPAKSHYLFNLRDLAKVVFGICMSEKEKVNNPEALTRLWIHEVLRVFGDRLINDDDKIFLIQNIRKVYTRFFGLNMDTVCAFLDQKEGPNRVKDGKVDKIEELRQLIWTDVMTSFGSQKRVYEEVVDFPKLQLSIENSLKNYNQMSDKPMELVMFNFAVEHLLIISRILKSPGGHALCVGVGGSGVQSLTRLASHVMEYTVK